jgi:hypothetical protein
MGVQNSFFNSEGAPFDVLSEEFKALPWQSEASIGNNCQGHENMAVYYDINKKNHKHVLSER